jgi:hypothetical protein
MNTNYKDVMSQRTDEELIKIVTIDRDSYQPLAVETAEEEIKKRNIDTTKIEEIKIDAMAQIEEQKQFETKKVSSWKRLIHFIVDTISFFILCMIIDFVLELFIHTTNPALIYFCGLVMLAIGFFGYYIFMETKYQKTIGKFITKTSVVTKNGAKPEVSDTSTLFRPQITTFANVRGLLYGEFFLKNCIL